MLDTTEFWKEIINDSTECIVLLSPEHKILFFNRAEEELFKRNNTQLKLNEDFRKYVIPQNYEIYNDIFARGLKGETSVVERNNRLEKDNFWMQYEMKPVYDISGTLFGLKLRSVDITDLKETQIELSHKHDILGAVMDSTNDNILVLDPNYKVIAFNKAAQSYSLRSNGLKIKIGDDHRKHLSPDFQNLLLDTFIKALKGESSVFEIERNFMNGESKWIEVKFEPVYTLNKKLLGVSRTIRDIEKRKRAELTLQESEEKFRKILESASVPILILDKRMNIVIVNPETEIVFGYRHDELINKNLQILIPERFHDAHTAHEHSYFHNPKSYRMGMNRQISAVRKDGEEIIVEVALNYFSVKSEQFVIAILQDITPRIRGEQKISDQLKRFETISWLQSHEVRRPLANILGLVNLIEMEKDAGYNQEYLDHLKESADELDTIIHKIVEHSQDLDNYFEETGFKNPG